MRFFVSCPFGLSKLVQNELKYLGLTPHHSFETWVYVDGVFADMMRINLRSRIANKVYLEAAFGPCFDFDQLFDLVQKVDWKKYVNEGQNVIVSVHTKWSKLESTRTIQAITNKAIFKQISPDTKREIDVQKESVEVFVMILNNQASIFINSSWAPLHQRGYRSQTGEAPLKENLAAALVVLSNWKYGSPFWDPFCGSGTLGIEAALLARNIAPGLSRNFAFQSWKIYDSKIFENVVADAKKKQYTQKKYQILCSDMDEKIVELAKINAEKAGVADTITFSQHDITSPLLPYDLEPLTIVCNPPYGKRLTSDDFTNIYTHLISHIQQSVWWGFITSWKGCETLLPKDWRKKKLFNGADECIFYFR